MTVYRHSMIFRTVFRLVVLRLLRIGFRFFRDRRRRGQAPR